MMMHIDLSSVLRQTLSCELYSNLVTRPTGAAVRAQIEALLADARERSLTVIDFSHVGMIDFSCADEVVAKLLLRYVSTERAEARGVLPLPRRDATITGTRSRRCSSGTGSRSCSRRTTARRASSASWATASAPRGRRSTSWVEPGRRIWRTRSARTSRTRGGAELPAPPAAGDAHRGGVHRRGRHRDRA